MAWNGLGNEGAVPLGWALRLNRQLLELDISNNDIQERGMMVRRPLRPAATCYFDWDCPMRRLFLPTLNISKY